METEPPRLETYHFYRRDWESVEELNDWFEWEVPRRMNVADYVCSRWVEDGSRTAIRYENADGRTRSVSFRRLERRSNQLAHYLRERGVERGDRVGVNAPSRPETAVAHIAAWKLGAVSVPLSTLFGPEGLKYRLGDCEVRACVVGAGNSGPLRVAREEIPSLETVLVVGEAADPAPDEERFDEAIEACPTTLESADTRSEDPYMIIYTSGTTGDPKGTLHTHEFILGNLPGYLTGFCNLRVQPGDVNWHVAEWGWVSSLFLGLFCPMFYGNPVLAYEGGSFDPEKAFELVERYDVTNFFAPPTGLRMMMQVEDPGRFDVSSVRTVSSGGESVGQSIVEWADDAFGGAAVHELYGQTEAHTGIGDCTALYPFREGTLGRPIVGNEITLLDPEDPECEVENGEIGEVAIRYEGHPACFKEYWNKPEATRAKRHGGWHLYEDLGTRDEDGYYTFVGRKDDVIISSGYRIGPEEVEESLCGHPAVADAGVIGVPDEQRGAIPKAFVVLAAGTEPSESLREELQHHVKQNLAKYEYPRALEFIDDLPKTTTGKVRRRDLREREGIL